MWESLLCLDFIIFAWIHPDSSTDQVAVSPQFGHLPVLSPQPVLPYYITANNNHGGWRLPLKHMKPNAFFLTAALQPQHHRTSYTLRKCHLPFSAYTTTSDCLVSLWLSGETVRHSAIHPGTTTGCVSLGSTVRFKHCNLSKAGQTLLLRVVLALIKHFQRYSI